MAHEMIVAMHVLDDEGYARYRDAMRPLLESYGGGFRYDFVVSKVLRSEAEHPINRVFAIHFRDRESRDAFFADPRYRAVRERFFDASVGARTLVAEHEVQLGTSP